MMTENLAQTAFGAGPFDGAADRSGRGDDADATQVGRNRGMGGGGRGLLRWPPTVPQGKTAAFEATAEFAHGLNIALAPQMLLGAETHGREKEVETVPDCTRQECVTLVVPCYAIKPPSSAYVPYDGAIGGLCGRQQWTCGRGSRSCGRVSCGVGGRWVAWLKKWLRGD